MHTPFFYVSLNREAFFDLIPKNPDVLSPVSADAEYRADFRRTESSVRPDILRQHT